RPSRLSSVRSTDCPVDQVRVTAATRAYEPSCHGRRSAPSASRAVTEYVDPQPERAQRFASHNASVSALAVVAPAIAPSSHAIMTKGWRRYAATTRQATPTRDLRARGAIGAMLGQADAKRDWRSIPRLAWPGRSGPDPAARSTG